MRTVTFNLSFRHALAKSESRLRSELLLDAARLIVSGDSHLVNLETWREVKVIDPTHFVAAYLER
jgi:hypothetical protein